MNTRLILLLLCALLSACDALFGYASGDAQEGIVVDTETGEPISDAFVIGQWSTDGYERTICFHLAMTKSDKFGKYHIPAWRKKSKFGSGDESVAMHAYKPGYHQPYLDLDGRLRLENVAIPPEDVEKRIAIIREAARQISCYSAGESKMNVAAFHMALYEEALAYAGDEVFEDILFLRELVERHELGYDKANERYKSGLRELKEIREDQYPSETIIIDTTDRFVGGKNPVNEDNR